MGISYCVTNSFDLGSRYLIVTANADETSRERAREGKDEGMVGVAEEGGGWERYLTQMVFLLFLEKRDAS